MRETLSNGFPSAVFERYRFLRPDLNKIQSEVCQLEKLYIRIESMFLFLKLHSQRNEPISFQAATASASEILRVEMEKLAGGLEIWDKKHRAMEMGLRVELFGGAVLIVGLLFAGIQAYFSRANINESIDKNKDSQQYLNVDLLVVAILAIFGTLYSQIKNTVMTSLYTTITEEFTKELTGHTANLLSFLDKLDSFLPKQPEKQTGYDAHFFEQTRIEFVGDSVEWNEQNLEEVWHDIEENKKSLSFTHIKNCFSVIHWDERNQNNVMKSFAGNLDVQSRLATLRSSDTASNELVNDVERIAQRVLRMPFFENFGGIVQPEGELQQSSISDNDAEEIVFTSTEQKSGDRMNSL